ncbi:MAG TPA: hypothetical protein VFQ35_23240 [Polyangiaceae bacterium]|nr:hypothetical protein [Polyangiaceae bacterium]
MVSAAFSRAWLSVRELLRTPRGILWLLAWIPIVALCVIQLELVGDFRIDDAYITFSFSKNLAAGNGPVFSHGV